MMRIVSTNPTDLKTWAGHPIVHHVVDIDSLDPEITTLIMSSAYAGKHRVGARYVAIKAGRIFAVDSELIAVPDFCNMCVDTLWSGNVCLYAPYFDSKGTYNVPVVAQAE